MYQEYFVNLSITFTNLTSSADQCGFLSCWHLFWIDHSFSFFSMYQTKFDMKMTKVKQNYMANMIMNVSGTLCQLIHYFHELDIISWSVWILILLAFVLDWSYWGGGSNICQKCCQVSLCLQSTVIICHIKVWNIWILILIFGPLNSRGEEREIFFLLILITSHAFTSRPRGISWFLFYFQWSSLSNYWKHYFTLQNNF